MFLWSSTEELLQVSLKDLNQRVWANSHVTWDPAFFFVLFCFGDN